MKQNSFSLKYRMLVWFVALLMPLVLLLSAFTIIQVAHTRNQLMTSEGTNLQLLTSRIQQETEEIEEYLYDLSTQNRVFRSMADPQSETTLFSSAYEVFETSDSLFHTLKDLSFLVIYSESNEFCAYRDQGLNYLTIQDQFNLRRAVEKRCVRYFLGGNTYQRDWFEVEIAERWFLCRIVRYQGMYCASLFDLSEMIDQLSSEIKPDAGLVFRNDSQLLTALPEHVPGIQAQELVAKDRLGERYGVLSQQLCGIYLTYIFPYNGIIGIMGWSFFLVLLIAVVVTGLLLLFYLRLNRDVFRPLDGLVDTMQRIRDSGSSMVLSDETIRCTEFRQVNHIFNQMIQQIQRLKIKHYEQKIETQQTELAFLQAQIRPHFYLNCLKTLYSLAEQRQYADIETCILLVSKHLRYAFQAHLDMVPMREELGLCDNYIKLYAIMTERMPTLTLDIESALFDTPIPPISLLTFIENSIRINLTPTGTLEINIRAKRMQTEDGSILCLTVQDNGSGFQEDQLELLNSDEWLKASGSHVGLQNVIRRFRILYGDDFSIAFFNRDGAQIEMYLPLDRKPEEVHNAITDS